MPGKYVVGLQASATFNHPFVMFNLSFRWFQLALQTEVVMTCCLGAAAAQQQKAEEIPRVVPFWWAVFAFRLVVLGSGTPYGCGSTPMVPFWLVGAPPMLEPVLVGIGMFTGGYDLGFDPGQMDLRPGISSWTRTAWCRCRAFHRLRSIWPLAWWRRKSHGPRGKRRWVSTEYPAKKWRLQGSQTETTHVGQPLSGSIQASIRGVQH